MKIYSGLYQEWNPFDSFYPRAELVVARIPDDLVTTGILIIWGGEDIHPSYYSRPNEGSHVSALPSHRDKAEWALMNKAVSIGLPIMGVCRGAQMACAMAGGVLIQDVNGHHQGHGIETHDGEFLHTSSCHHQMMYPWEVEHRLLAWSIPSHSDHYSGLLPHEKTIREQINVEPEIVWFPTIKCLAIQGHPEWLHPSTPFNCYTKKLIDEFLIAT